ncbi:MAG: hypothetical protein ACE5I3_08670 [Phycisphaerae bacterium]
MSKLLEDFRNLHRAPDDWELRDYASHAWRLTRQVWLLMLVFCVVLGAVLPRHNPAQMFDEYRPFTIYTVILLGICGFVCAQCARLAVTGGPAAWTLMAIGFFFLALDDLTQIHEGLDKVLNGFLGLDPKAKLPDLLDAGIVVLYGIVGALVLYLHRRHFFKLQGFEVGIVQAAGAAVVMVILDVVGDLVNAQVSKGVLGILEDSFEALAVSRFFWTFVTARFQLRRPDEYLREARFAAAAASKNE